MDEEEVTRQRKEAEKNNCSFGAKEVKSWKRIQGCGKDAWEETRGCGAARTSLPRNAAGWSTKPAARGEAVLG